ncbi:phage portal protein [Psychrobacillus lasiicapitis]|uniref:Phage portal protein n=1 Tax=Psychrobacillus lasiicapitis TaxID=1636719 RepID=A0A544TAA0_9BACI|nr:phage portal protein [Psychrobacillus lasiicapitis]TQR14383.1 phage portal protein [Psychrobacillus lasiicapitis]GGA31808.1 phage portal protein [Psychrobacillus lasiicapitis]
MAIIRDRDLIEDINDIPVVLIANCIKDHQAGLERLNKLEDYYKGKHTKILERELGGEDKGLPNNKLVANHAKYITDIATGYVFGKPIKYEGKQIEAIKDAYEVIDIVSHDSELSKDLSIFGIGLELYFMSSDDEPIPKATVIDPRQIFLVVDDTVEYKSLFGVHYYEKKDIENKPVGWKINVYTKDLVVSYQGKNLNEFDMVDIKQHYFGDVPVVEFWNNEEQQGDFEQQISLIDAYNLLQSDRVNDKEQLVDALLKVVGVSFGDTEEEQSATARMLKKHKILELPDNADAEWLVKQLNETEVEVLKDAIKSDIHEFSMVPAMTDENFAANASGVAMKYKLFGMEQLAVIKERYYIQGLRERLKLFANILKVKAKAVDVSDTIITMIRNLPENDLTIQELVSLIGLVSNETLLSLLPFVEDATEEIKKLKKQLKEDLERTQKEFGYPMDSPEDVTGDEEEE